MTIFWGYAIDLVAPDAGTILIFDNINSQRELCLSSGGAVAWLWLGCGAVAWLWLGCGLAVAWLCLGCGLAVGL